MTIIKAITIVSIFFTAVGCSSIKRTGYFVPEKEGAGWTEVVNKKGFLQFGEIPSDISHKCGETVITFYSDPIFSGGSFGPPFIPFPFPYFSDESARNIIPVFAQIASPDNKTEILKAVIEVGNKQTEPAEKFKHEDKDDSKTMYKYVFKLNWQDIKRYVLLIETTDPECGALSIPYNRQFHFVYSMI